MADRYGTALLALTTLRPADLGRGAGIVHHPLDLPAVVAAQVRAWELGQRNFLPGHEAAALLWTLPVAGYLDGRLDAWRDIPGVAELDAGLVELDRTDEANWPNGQAALRTLVAVAGGQSGWAALARLLTKTGVDVSLNDLVLLFKYAAVGRDRPIARVADLFRLLRSLVVEPGPADAAGVLAWLGAPIVVPHVFTSGSGRRGPSPLSALPPRSEVPVLRFDAADPKVAAALHRLEVELDGLVAAAGMTQLRTVLRSATGLAPDVIDRVVGELQEDGAEPSAARRGRSIVVGGNNTRTARGVIQTYLFGSPVLIDTSQAAARLAKQRREWAEVLVRGLPERIRNRLQTLKIAAEDLTWWPDLLPHVQPTPSYLEPAGRNDLLLVRQQTTGYRRAEIAHVENVLIGEERTRTHTDRTLTRTELFESVERETEETRDLQTTDRAELSREVSKVVSEDLHLEGSVQTTSRGPTKIVASAGASMDRATEEAASTAETYARETVERAVKRTLERVTRQSRSLFERETLEENSHAFRRADDAQNHVSGVYQYLERVSRAKIFWYGERELYDIVVPEPAALIWQLAITRPEISLPIDEPDHALFEQLTLNTISSRLEDVIRAFRVTDIPPEPAPTRVATFTFAATGGGDDAHHATAKEVQIPDGYELVDAMFVVTAETEDADDTPNGGIAVGEQIEIWSIALTGNQGQTSMPFTFPNPLAGPTVAVAFNADNFTSIAGSVTLNLRLRASAQRDWAATALGLVAERYEHLRREYAQAVAQAAANRPAESVNLPEGARKALAQIVRGEVQRAAIDVMRNHPVDFDLIESYGYTNPDGSSGTHPVIDYERWAADVPEVQFLQQAFEWDHASWVLYPYFWGRRSEWGRMIVTGHPDPDFLAFLNAGAARVQLPVRPGFEDLVKHYMETREVYAGEGLPRMGDLGYVPFIDEQLSSLGAPGDEVPWPPGNPREWDIVAPTSLVLVRGTDLSTLPGWDPATGAEI